ncbi:MAG: transcription termination factor NusA [Sumerlaeia bacterium]
MAKKKKKEPVYKVLNIKPLIKAIASEKDLDADIIKQAVESAIMSAASKREHNFNEPRPELDINTGEMRIYAKKKVVISVLDEDKEIDILSAKERNPEHMMGQEIEVEIDPESFGRIAAQSVRQGILQRLRDAERDRIYDDYKDKVGSVTTCIVQRYERRDCVVSLGKTECLLPHHEIPMGIRYRNGDRLRCLIVDVRRSPKGPQVILSRTRSELVKQLFATEVPEISDGTVRIVEIAREPGTRTKIAVNSMNPDVDPVGACVGPKGQRVQAIVRELDNEKIDIVPYSAIPEHFIESALNPAVVINMKLNELQKHALVIVDGDSLSKAIGKRGQNAKLAGKLTGWKIDVREQETEEELARLDEENRNMLADFLSQIEGLSGFSKDALGASKELNSVERLSTTSPSQLLPFTNDDQEMAEQIVQGAANYLRQLNEMRQSADEPDADSEFQYEDSADSSDLEDVERSADSIETAEPEVGESAVAEEPEAENDEPKPE